MLLTGTGWCGYKMCWWRVSRVVEREHAGKGSKHEKKTYHISFRGGGRGADRIGREEVGHEERNEVNSAYDFSF